MRLPRNRQRRTLRTLALLATSVLALAGCSSGGVHNTVESDIAVTLPPMDEIEWTEDASALEGPGHAYIGGPSIDPVATDPESALPATVTSLDLDGSRPEVTITDTSRIIALSITGTLADLVAGLGFEDHLVGRDIATNTPGTKDLPLVTGASHTVNEEAIIALSPSVVFTDGSIGPDDVVRIQLRAAGIPVVAVERVTDFDSTYAATRLIAEALGVPELGEQLASEIRDAVESKIAEIHEYIPKDPAKRPRVVFLYLRGTNSPFFMFGEGSGVDTLLQSIGAIDVASEAGWKGERPLTPEALPALNPDVIMVMTGGLKSIGTVDELIAGVPGVALTNAGERRRIIDVNDTLLFAGGTRSADVLDGLARALYAPDSLRPVE